MNVRSALMRYGDRVLAAGLAVLYVVEVFFSGEVEHHRATAAAVAVLLECSLLVRRTMPALPILAAMVVIQLNHTVLVGLAEGGTFMITMIIAFYSAGCYSRGWMRPGCALLIAACIPLAAFDPRQPPQVGDWIFFLVFAGAPFVAGVVFDRRRERDRELTEMASQAQLEGEQRAAAAVAEERARIARELHDVVSHAISVVVVQARGGRRTLGGTAPEARQAFDTIESSGEQALVEMRRLLEVLRTEGLDEASLSPAPGLDRIGALVKEVSGNGLAVELVQSGELAPLPPGVELSAYRIVQESLTNVVKHARATHACVVLDYRPDELAIEVSDDGAGGGDGGGTGRGLLGIRERVDLYGGELQVRRPDTGGFVVHATLPVGVAGP